MENHVCVNKALIEKLQKDTDDLKKEIKDAKDENTSNKMDLIEIKSDVKHVINSMSELKNTVQKIADEPKRKWEQLSKQVLSFIVGGACIGFILWMLIIGKEFLSKAS